jgi:hypothetical protein
VARWHRLERRRHRLEGAKMVARGDGPGGVSRDRAALAQRLWISLEDGAAQKKKQVTMARNDENQALIPCYE